MGHDIEHMGGFSSPIISDRKSTSDFKLESNIIGLFLEISLGRLSRNLLQHLFTPDAEVLRDDRNIGKHGTK